MLVSSQQIVTVDLPGQLRIVENGTSEKLSPIGKVSIVFKSWLAH